MKEGKSKMATDLNRPNLFTPIMLWTDMGMRALEMTLSSSQNIGEGIDRLARASGNAGPDVVENAAEAVPRLQEQTGQNSPALPLTSGLQLAMQMQRATLDLMTQGWQQWMNTLGTLASMGSGRGFGESDPGQNPWMNVMREGMRWGGLEQSGATEQSGSSARQQGGRARSADWVEHAAARAEPQRRSRAAKPKARTRSSRNS
jgi:hypothetical protein